MILEKMITKWEEEIAVWSKMREEAKTLRDLRKNSFCTGKCIAILEFIEDLKKLNEDKKAESNVAK